MYKWKNEAQYKCSFTLSWRKGSIRLSVRVQTFLTLIDEHPNFDLCVCVSVQVEMVGQL